jgi:hypothetical protein
MKKILDQLGFIIIIYGLALGFVLLTILIFETGVFVITTNNIYSWYTLLIKPIPYLIAIYMYLAVKDLKQDYEAKLRVLNQKLGIQHEQIEHHTTLDNIRIDKIKKLEDEIGVLKLQKFGNAVKEKIEDKEVDKHVEYGSQTYKKGDYYIGVDNIKWICIDVTPYEKNGIQAFNYHFVKAPILFNEDNNTMEGIIIVRNATKKDTKEFIDIVEDNDTTQEIVLCPECNREMRECKTMWICDWDKKRVKKEAL